MKHRWRTTRIVILGAGTVYLAVILPVNVVLHPLSQSLLSLTILGVCLLFIIEMLLNVRYLKGRGQRYVQSYYRRWFIFDILGLIPWVLIFPDSPLQLLQLLKIIRVSALVTEYIRRSPRYSAIMRLSHFAYIMLIALHWIACSWIAIRPTSESDIGYHYIKALYWATTTVATVGYGDITPKEPHEMLFAIGVMLVGVVMYGYMIGNVASLINNMDPARNRYLEHLERVHAFIRYRNLPEDMERRITDYYHYIWEKRFSYDESNIIADLPPGLKTEVSLYLKRDVIEHVHIFRNASEEFVREIASNIHPQIVLPGEFVFKSGDSAHSMYFINHGSVEIIASDGKVIATMGEGDFFGEMALLHKRKRNASVRTLDYTDLYVLDVKTFDRILAEHPEFRLSIEKMAKSRASTDAS